MLRQLFGKRNANTPSAMESARAAVKKERYDEAVHLLDGVIGRTPDNAEAHFLRGFSRLNLNQTAAALPDLACACVSIPEQAEHHYALALAYFRLDNRTEALVCCRAALRADPSYQPARRLMSEMTLYGEVYFDVLMRLHQYLKPRTYVEIGVYQGLSGAIVQPGTRAIGIDPDPKPGLDLSAVQKLFRSTSDDFFARHDLSAELGAPVDLAFIDGMHQFEFVLRDFINIEKHCTPGSVVLVHDAFPDTREVADRTPRELYWTGDVWRAVMALKENRPELMIETIATPPSGLTLIRNLNPASTLLADRLQSICDKYLTVPYEQLDECKGAAINLFPNDWDHIRRLLPQPFRS